MSIVKVPKVFFQYHFEFKLNKTFLLVWMAVISMPASNVFAEHTLSAYPVSQEEITERHALVENQNRRSAERTSCHEDGGFIQKTEGGCKLNETGLVYSGIEYTVTPLSIEGWLDRTAAMFRCRMSTKGGYFDWRLPTEEEVLDAAPYFLALGLDPYLYYWTSKQFNTTETIYASKKLGNKVLSEKKEKKIIGYSSHNDRFFFDPYVTSRTVPEFGETTTITSEINRVLHAEFDFNVNNMRLVRPSLSETFTQKYYTPGDVRGTINSDVEKMVDSPLTISQPYSAYLGQSWGTKTETIGRSVKKTQVGSHSEGVDPRAYGLEVATPENVTKNQIGLFCVRGKKKAQN